MGCFTEGGVAKHALSLSADHGPWTLHVGVLLMGRLSRGGWAIDLAKCHQQIACIKYMAR